MRSAAPVRKSDINAVWHQAEPFLVTALERSGRYHDLEYVRRKLLDGEADLWVGTNDGVWESVAVTEIQIGDDFKVPRIWLWASERGADWIAECLPVMEAWAKAHGTIFETECRPGLSRTLRGSGWKVVRVVMRKELRNGQL